MHTDRGELRAPLVVDALGWRRVLSNERADPAACRRGSRAAWRSIAAGSGEDLEIWIDRRYVRAGYSWSFPAADELRIGCGSFEPRDHVKDPTVALAGDSRRARRALPGQLDPPQAAPRDRTTACSSSATRPATACR